MSNNNICIISSRSQIELSTNTNSGDGKIGVSLFGKMFFDLRQRFAFGLRQIHEQIDETYESADTVQVETARHTDHVLQVEVGLGKQESNYVENSRRHTGAESATAAMKRIVD